MAVNEIENKKVELSQIHSDGILKAGTDEAKTTRLKNLVSQWGNFPQILAWEKEGELVSLDCDMKIKALALNGNRTATVTILPIQTEADAAQFALIWASLTKNLNNITNSLLIKKLLKIGITRKNLQDILHVSKSWLSARESIAENLDNDVFNLVKDNILPPRTAEAISRLQPKELQLEFSKKVLDYNINKNQVDKLVSIIMNKNTDKSFKEEILKSPQTFSNSYNEQKPRKIRIKTKKDDLTTTTNSLQYTLNHLKNAIEIYKNMKDNDNAKFTEYSKDFIPKLEELINLIKVHI
jgi:polyhydroxyalkanoate synthesis regulator phasin